MRRSVDKKLSGDKGGYDEPDLLKHCTNVKTVRLCLRLGRELSLPWVDKLDTAALARGSGRPWISKFKDGLLVLKP